MVVICLPMASLTDTPQERIATPSIWTVQAPHSAMPQPYLVPVSPIFSRIAHSSGVSGSTSTSKVLPLIVRFAIAIPFFGPTHRLDFGWMLDWKLESFKSRICVCNEEQLICSGVTRRFTSLRLRGEVASILRAGEGDSRQVRTRGESPSPGDFASLRL